MKHLFRLSIIAAIALSFVACSKEIESQIVSEGKSVQLTFSSEKPGLNDVDTKTVWDGSTILWAKGDAIRIAYTVNGNWQTASGNGSPAKMYASNSLTDSEAGEVANFNVSTYFTDTDNENLVNPVYKFYGLYPSAAGETNFTNAPTLNVTIPATQTPAASSFDSSADIMVAASDDYDGIPTNRLVDLTWNRLVAHADISMRNLQVGPGETLEEITITAQSGADLVGAHNLNITTGALSLPANATPNNSVVVKADNLTLSSGAVEFWFTSLPFTASELTFTVKTDKYTYVRQFTGLSLQFQGNARNTLNVNMKLAQKFQDYTESFGSGQGEFTTSGDSGIWTASSHNSDYFMKGTSRINNTNTDGEGWLISPFLSINSSDSELSFKQAINAYFKNSSQESTLSTEATVWAREKDGAWQQIAITYPTLPSSGFTDFVATTASLSSFNGKTIQIGFKYVGYSSTSNGGCGTWEISDFKVTNSEIVYYPSFTFTSATTKEVSFSASTVEFTYDAAHLTSAPTVAVKAGSDDIIDGTPTIGEGKVTVNIKANDETVAKSATLVVTCEGVTGISELVINQAGKSSLVETQATIDFTSKGYTNEQVVTSVVQDPFTVTFTKGGTNDPKYFTSGGGSLRFYNGGSMTVSSEYTITQIVMTGDVAATVGGSAVSNKTWSGSATSVVFSATGTNKIKTLTITYLAPAASATPIISLSNLPTSNIAAAGEVVTINYEITNPKTGVTVSASAGSDTWVNSFDYSTLGEISFVVDQKTTTGTRTATITVSYEGAASQTFEIIQDGATSGGDPSTPTTVTKTINDIVSANGYTVSSGTTINDIVTSFALDSNVTISTSGDPNCGSFWGTSTIDWRLYQNQGGDLTISVPSDKTLVSATITFTVSNKGKLMDGTATVTSGSSVALSGTSKTFTIGYTGTDGKNNGQIRVTAISVTYQ